MSILDEARARYRAARAAKRNGTPAQHLDELPEEQRGDAWEPPAEHPATAGQAAPYTLPVIDSATLADGDYRLRWHVERILVRGQPGILGGPVKALKTSLAIDLAVSVATGEPYLGEYRVHDPCPVLVLSGESGEATIQDTARRVAAAKGRELRDLPVYWGWRLPQLADATHLAALAEAIERHRVGLLIYDPLYLGLLAGAGAEGLSASNVYQIGPLLMAVGQACLAVGCTPLLVHHYRTTRAETYGEPQLADLAYAGVREYARQWILLGRREPYDAEDPEGRHALWLAAGGSAGHSLLRAVDVCEGRVDDHFGGRTWRVTVSTPSGIRQSAESEAEATRRRKEQERDREDESRLLAALDRLVTPEQSAVGYTRIRGLSGLSGDRMARATERLIAEGILDRVEVQYVAGKGARRTADGLRRLRGGGPSEDLRSAEDLPSDR